MRTGTVTGAVWATRRLDGLPAGAFLRVALDDSAGAIIALDLLGSGVGERVLVAEGMSAARRFPDAAPVDALIIGSLDPLPQVHDRQEGDTGV
jgi:ethanolamine utilization protein EutN